MLYYYGQGINKDYSKAKELFAKAADANNMYAQFRLGVMYEHGFGVSTDFKKSYEYYKKSANQGFHKEVKCTITGSFIPIFISDSCFQ